MIKTEPAMNSFWIIHPDNVGPTARAKFIAIPNMPIAKPRLLGGNKVENYICNQREQNPRTCSLNHKSDQ